MNLHPWSLWNWMTPQAPEWLFHSTYRADGESFSGWRKVFAAERELVLKEKACNR